MVNIVMLTRGRRRLLAQSLSSLYDTTNTKLFNLTILDDGSDDFRVAKVLEAASSLSNCSVSLMSRSRHITADLRNLAVEASRCAFGSHDWLYLSDNDVYFLPGWLETLTTAAEQSEPDKFRLWGGQVHPYHRPTPYKGHMTEHFALDGPSWLMRWATWMEFGPLVGDGQPGPCHGEDGRFCDALRAADGFRIGVVQPEVVIHVGLTQTDGGQAPGAEIRESMLSKIPGIVYE